MAMLLVVTKDELISTVAVMIDDILEHFVDVSCAVTDCKCEVVDNEGDTDAIGGDIVMTGIG